jgi:hypothetical protein
VLAIRELLHQHYGAVDMTVCAFQWSAIDRAFDGSASSIHRIEAEYLLAGVFAHAGFQERPKFLEWQANVEVEQVPAPGLLTSDTPQLLRLRIPGQQAKLLIDHCDPTF